MEVMDWLWSLFPDGHMDLEVYDENLNCKLVIVSGLQQMSMN